MLTMLPGSQMSLLSFKSLFKSKDLKKIALDYKLLGEAAIQVSYLQKKVVKVSHFNRETLRAEKCDDKGAINAYYYHPKWKDYKDGDKLTRIPAFGSGAKKMRFTSLEGTFHQCTTIQCQTTLVL